VPPAAADLNGDAKSDLAVGYGLLNMVSVLINRGDGTFKAASTIHRIIRNLWQWAISTAIVFRI